MNTDMSKTLATIAILCSIAGCAAVEKAAPALNAVQTVTSFNQFVDEFDPNTIENTWDRQVITTAILDIQTLVTAVAELTHDPKEAVMLPAYYDRAVSSTHAAQAVYQKYRLSLPEATIAHYDTLSNRIDVTLADIAQLSGGERAQQAIVLARLVSQLVATL